jgi:hypothetical protein
MKALLGIMMVTACCLPLNALAATESNMDTNERPMHSYQTESSTLSKHDSYMLQMNQRTNERSQAKANHILPDPVTRAHTHCTKGGNISTHSRIKY